MRIERALTNVETLGPGRRLAIWVNGCKRRCPGCVSKRLQLANIATEFPIEEYFEGFDFSKVDGVTISGGEPFEQIAELSKLVCYLKKEKIEDILVYTGYQLSELQAMQNQDVDTILENIAVLIDGPYILELDDQKHNLKGSSNQEIHYLLPKYETKYQEYIKTTRKMQEFEIENTLIGVGIPDELYIKNFNK